MFGQVCCPAKKTRWMRIFLCKNPSHSSGFLFRCFFRKTFRMFKFPSGISLQSSEKRSPKSPHVEATFHTILSATNLGRQSRKRIWNDDGVRSRLMVAINLLTIGALVREKYRSYFHNCLFQNISKACFQKKQHCHTAVDELMMKRYQSKARPFLQELQFPLGVALRLEFLRSARCKIPLKNIENHSIL